eukprot:9484446-Pyramimonas_sp.AAC.2
MAQADLALNWGKLHLFVVGVGEGGEPRYQAYGSGMVPLTDTLRAWPFAFWALMTQQAQHTHL